MNINLLFTLCTISRILIIFEDTFALPTEANLNIHVDLSGIHTFDVNYYNLISFFLFNQFDGETCGFAFVIIIVTEYAVKLHSNILVHSSVI